MMVTAPGAGAVAGAVYRPLESIVPQGFPLPVQALPLRLQLTAVLFVPVTVAVNGTFCVTYTTDMLPSLTVTDGVLPRPFAQPVQSATFTNATVNKQFLVMMESRM